VIRVRGIPISDRDAKDLVQRLLDDETGIGVAARLTRAIEMDGGVIGTSKPEARAVLGAVDFLLDRGPSGSLLELRASLVDQLCG
jgi:hypothetical protein